MYAKPGWYATPLGAFVPDMCAALIARPAGVSFEQALRSFMGRRELGFAGNKAIGNLTETDIYTLSSDHFPPGSGLEELQFMLTLWLNSIGVQGVPDLPVIPRYRMNPRLTLNEVVDLLITERIGFTDLKELGPTATVDVAIGSFAKIVRQIASLRPGRQVYAKHIIDGVKHIGYNLALGHQPDQMDKSIYLALCCASDLAPDGISYYFGYNSGRANVTSGQKFERLRPAFSNDQEVHDTMQRVRNLVEPGPWWRFVTAISNANDKRLFAWVGYHARTLPLHTGFMVPRGPFYEFVKRHTLELDWALDRQTAGLYDAQMPVIRDRTIMSTGLTNEDPFIMMEGLREDPITGHFNSIIPSWDDPDVTITLTEGMDSYLDQVAPEYISPTRKHIVDAGNAGLTPASYVLEKCMTQSSWGGGELATVDITDFKTLFLDERYAGEALRVFAPVPEQIVFPIYLRAGGTSGTNIIRVTESSLADKEEKGVDFSLDFMPWGRTMIRPPLTDFVATPRSALFEKQDALESRVVSALNLSPELAAINDITIRVCVNDGLARFLWRAPIAADIPALLSALNGGTIASLASLPELSDSSAVVVQ